MHVTLEVLVPVPVGLLVLILSFVSYFKNKGMVLEAVICNHGIHFTFEPDIEIVCKN